MIDAVEYDPFAAAQEQLVWALAAFRAGAWGAALTLAGAAEECLPRVDEQTAFKIYNELASARYGGGEIPRELEANRARNWFKHHYPETPTMIVSAADVRLMLIRAVHRLQLAFPDRAHHGAINDFARAIQDGGSELDEAPQTVIISPQPNRD